MKKLYAIIILAGSGLIAMAGEPFELKKTTTVKKIYGDGGQCFDESTRIINVGVGLAASRYYSSYRGRGYSHRSSPAFSLSYEQALMELGPGYLGIGAYTGFHTFYSRYQYYYNNGNNHYYYENRWNNFVVAARAAYHFDELNFENGELYGGLMVGLRFHTYSYETNDPDPNKNYYYSGGSAYLASSVFIGGRWYFGKRVALYGEVGYGISYGTLGLSFKF
jgi:hypothetical protein